MPGAPSSTNCLQYCLNNRNNQTLYGPFLCFLMQRDDLSPMTLYYEEKTFSIVSTCLLAENSRKVMATKFFRFFCCVISAQLCIKINREFFDREKTTICFLEQYLNKLNISVFYWLELETDEPTRQPAFTSFNVVFY